MFLGPNDQPSSGLATICNLNFPWTHLHQRLPWTLSQMTCGRPWFFVRPAIEVSLYQSVIFCGLILDVAIYKLYSTEESCHFLSCWSYWCVTSEEESQRSFHWACKIWTTHFRQVGGWPRPFGENSLSFERLVAGCARGLLSNLTNGEQHLQASQQVGMSQTSDFIATKKCWYKRDPRNFLSNSQWFKGLRSHGN